MHTITDYATYIQHKMKKEIDFNDDFALEYDEIIHKIIPGYEVIYELIYHLFTDSLNEKAKILIAGAGSGKEILKLSKGNPGWKFVGFDPAKKMLSIAKKKLEAFKIKNDVKLVQGLVDKIGYTDFDAATSILVMHFLPDDGTKSLYLKGISERLKPGAKLVLVDLEGNINSGEYKTLNNAWKQQQLASRNDDEQVLQEFMVRAKEVNFIPQSRIESLFSDAGFFNIHKFFKAYLFAGYVATKK